MKTQLSKRRNAAITRFELLVIVVAFMGLLVLLYLPVLATGVYRAARLNCANNLKKISMASRLWEGDGSTNSSYMMINETRTKQLLSGNVAAWFQTMSNELGTPEFFICPADTDHYITATNFADLHNSNISYFVNPDASEIYPQMILSGDDNLAVGGVPVPSGILEISSANPVSWTRPRHGKVGNIAYADGSVAQISSSGLQQALALATNGVPNPSGRLAIP